MKHVQKLNEEICLNKQLLNILNSFLLKTMLSQIKPSTGSQSDKNIINFPQSSQLTITELLNLLVIEQ